jgi:hypothetical protein
MAGEGTNSVKGIIGAIVVALVASGTSPWWWNALFSHDTGGTTNTPSSDFVCDSPTLSLSQGAGPSGTSVVITGKGFPPNRDVDIKFHTEDLAPAATDEQGSFEDTVVIPGTFDAFSGQQFQITATTMGCFKSTPFQLTS